MSKPETTTVESEFAAASAPACLKTEEKEEQQNEPGASKGAVNEEQQDFTIPQRFTKSGRKRAVPFTIKVSYLFVDGLAWPGLMEVMPERMRPCLPINLLVS